MDESGRMLLRWTIRFGALVVPATIVSDIWLDVNYELAANISLLIATVLVNLFTGLYGFRSRWRGSEIGPVYLVKCIAMSVFLAQASLTVWLDQDYPFRQQIRFAIYSYMVLVYIPMIFVLVREQQRDGQRRREAAEAEAAEAADELESLPPE